MNENEMLNPTAVETNEAAVAAAPKRKCKRRAGI